VTRLACMFAPLPRPGAKSPRFVVATVDHYFDTGKWPSERLMQNVMVELDDPTNVRREARRLAHGESRCSDGHVVVAVQDIYDAEPNHPLLDDFEAVLRFTTRRYKHGARRVEATLSARSLVDGLDFSAPQAHRAIGLLLAERLVVPGPPGEETMVISPRIRHFLRVRGIERYVEKKRWMDRRRRLRQLGRKPLGLVRWFKSEDTSAGAKIAVGVIAAVVATVLSAAVLWGLQELGSDGAAGQAQPHAKSMHSRRSAAARSGG
jgi:hypothetical protein